MHFVVSKDPCNVESFWLADQLLVGLATRAPGGANNEGDSKHSQMVLYLTI